jgi:glyoxylase-like metal-dependent hydrolase (beta-lactamase superfamily II)
VALVCEGANVAIVGDTLFAGSIGRSDLPGADPATLAASLERMLRDLPDATVVHPGHGPSTTIGAERRSNPFLQHGMDWARA